MTLNAIRLFEVFQEALKDLGMHDAWLCSQPKGKGAICHKLAGYLESRVREHGYAMPEGFVFDILLNHTDILLHDRAGKTLMSVMVFHDYIPSGQIEFLKQRIVEGAILTLAVAFIPGKDYLLIYHIKKETIDYYHYDLAEGDSQYTMQRDRKVGDGGQLQLLKPRRRKKKPS